MCKKEFAGAAIIVVTAARKRDDDHDNGSPCKFFLAHRGLRIERRALVRLTEIQGFPSSTQGRLAGSHVSRTNGYQVRSNALLARRLDSLPLLDRESTRLNSSHLGISYAVF